MKFVQFVQSMKIGQPGNDALAMEMGIFRAIPFAAVGNVGRYERFHVETGLICIKIAIITRDRCGLGSQNDTIRFFAQSFGLNFHILRLLLIMPFL